MKKWKYYPYESCPECGDDLEAHTDNKFLGEFYDGDVIKCVACEFKSVVSVADGECWVQEV